MLKYIKPLDVVEEYLEEHRQFLDQCYKKNFFIVSGPQIPRIGGVILSQLKDRVDLEEILNQDPFMINQVAEYPITEFNPVKYHESFSIFVE